MWSKGAVVIKKHGNAEWADSMEKILQPNDEPDPEKEDLQRENDYNKKHVIELFEIKIAEAEGKYGHNFNPPRPIRWIIEGFAFIIYWIAIFWDKYLVIKDPD